MLVYIKQLEEENRALRDSIHNLKQTQLQLHHSPAAPQDSSHVESISSDIPDTDVSDTSDMSLPTSLKEPQSHELSSQPILTEEESTTQPISAVTPVIPTTDTPQQPTTLKRTGSSLSPPAAPRPAYPKRLSSSSDTITRSATTSTSTSTTSGWLATTPGSDSFLLQSTDVSQEDVDKFFAVEEHEKKKKKDRRVTESSVKSAAKKAGDRLRRPSQFFSKKLLKGGKALTCLT